MCWCGVDEGNVGCFVGFGKGGIFGEEVIVWMDGLCVVVVGGG